MNREIVEKEILSLQNKTIVAELPTSFGKTKIALSIMNKRATENDKILIVIPKLILIENWKEEIKKWGYDKYLDSITFVTYYSFPKKVGHWDLVIFDEAHHLSERCLCEIGNTILIDNSVLISATIGRDKKKEIKKTFKDACFYYISLKKAIAEDILPDPEVYLMPLTLNQSLLSEKIIKNKNAKGKTLTCSFDNMWTYIRNYKNNRIEIPCTPSNYHRDMCKEIEFYRNKYLRTRSEALKNKWLKLCGERLKWLSNQKESRVSSILECLSKERVLTFCNSIEQTERLGSHSINSKKGDNDIIIQEFNSGKINHITACNMVDEGVNLVNCRVGLYANLSNSERLIKQRLGRLLRHPNPIIIIPYFLGTREMEIVDKMLEDYNKDLVHRISDLKEIKL